MRIPSSFQSGRLLKDVTTVGIGGLAQFYVEVRQVEELKEALAFCHSASLPYFILGKGSNTLFDDRGFAGVVIANRIDFIERKGEGCFRAGAGYSFSLLGTQTARQGWSGLEFASGIPASVGGAVYMNAGANGKETCETLTEVEYLTNEGELVVLPRSQIEFSYRFSSFQKWKGAIVGATFQLTPSLSAREKQIDIIRYRQKTQPYGAKSAGCLFRNPESSSAGAIIDQLGLKGTTVGGAQVSDLHANFLINAGGATSKDMLNLMAFIQQKVKEQKGIELEPEVRFIPYSLSDKETP